MSGGSWDYLHQKSVGEVAPDTMRDAAKRLAQLGDSLAAAEATAIAEALEGAAKRLERINQQLHDMEWVDSGDYSADQYVPLKPEES